MPEAMPPTSDDPFDRFNEEHGQGSIDDPYPLFAAMRAQGPVVEIGVEALLASEQGSAFADDPPPAMFSALSYDAVAEVLRDAKRFSSAGYSKIMGPVMGHSILEMDPPEHGQHRSLIQQAFLARSLERWERDVVVPAVHDCIDAFIERGRADLVRELTFPFPVTVIAGMIGLDEVDHDDFHRWAVELISINFAPERARAGSAKLRELFARVLDERRSQPRDDLMSLLAQAELGGQTLSDDAIFAFLRLLAPAGAETTYRSSSNLLYALLTHADQRRMLADDRSLMDAVTDEGLRWECPLTGIQRSATEDTELFGQRVPKGAIVHTNLGSANRDESRWERPDAFDITRPFKQHIAFAFGPHRCLGINLAMMETRVVVNALLDRLPDMQLDPAVEDVAISGLTFRSPRSLPIVFTPGERRAR